MTFRQLRSLNIQHLFRSLCTTTTTKNDKDNIVFGPEPQYQIPIISLGHLIFEKLSTSISKEPLLEDALTKETISNEEIFDKSISLAHSLRNSSFNKHSKLAVCSDNNLHFFVPIISCFFIGAPAIFINPVYTCMEKIHCFNMAKPELVFVSKSNFQEIDGLRKKFKMDYIKKMVTVDGSDLDDFITDENGATKCEDILEDIDPREDIALILFTSGTTGLPKGVELTHYNVVSKFFTFMDDRFYSQTGDTPHLGVLPFCHGYGLVATLYDLIMKKPVIILRSCEPELIFDTVVTYEIKRLWVGPFIFKIIAEDSVPEKYDLSVLREFSSAGSFLGLCVDQALKRKFKNAKVRQNFSLTETTSGALVNDYEKPHCGSCGKVVPHMACKVVDLETNECLEAYHVGEMHFKGPLVMKRYYQNGSFLKDGWLPSGDLGYYDYNQNFYFVSRIIDIINFENQLISPALLEDVMVGHPEIDDCGVVGLPSDGDNQLPFAFVVKSENSKLCETDVENYVKEQLSDPMRLKGGVVFVSKIPRSNFGKIRRQELRRFLEHLRLTK